MFTQKELVQAQNSSRPFMVKCDEYRALLTEHELPLSVDINVLTAAIKSQLFTKLLAVDAGLKMRYEMLRTEEAQQKLITDTIDLNGYDIVPELTRRIQELRGLYSSLMLRSNVFFTSPEKEGLSLGYLASHHELDLAAWLQSRRIDWTGNEHVLKYFVNLGQQLSQVRALFKATYDASASLQHVVGPRVAGFFTSDSNQGPIEPNEHLIFQQIIPALQAQGKLKDFPKNFN